MPLLLPCAATSALFAAAILTASLVAQPPQPVSQSGQPASTVPEAPRSPDSVPGSQPKRNYPAPTNLKVLPKNLSGREVHKIMETWAGSLNVHCNFCHAPDPGNLGPNGRPRLNFADDSKTEKKVARLMYTMTQQVNQDYISRAMDMETDDMGSLVSCGTCHRGHQIPEDFVIPREENHSAAPAAH
jgi:hypothetical protein